MNNPPEKPNGVAGIWFEKFSGLSQSVPRYCKNVDEVLEWQEAFEMIMDRIRDNEKKNKIRARDVSDDGFN